MSATFETAKLAIASVRENEVTKDGKDGFFLLPHQLDLIEELFETFQQLAEKSEGLSTAVDSIIQVLNQ